MYKINRIEHKVNALPIGKIVPFSYLEFEDILKDTIRRYLHRLHERGVISIVARGHFKRIEPFGEYLFVYGSLKKGFDNHKLLTKYSRRIGKAKTLGKFAMFEDSFGNYPYLIQKPINKVEGELYKIYRKELLDAIDEFEGAPDYYQRKKIKIKTHRGVSFAYAYMQENKKIPEKQKSLKVWEDNTDYKIEKLHNFLEKL